MDPVRACLACRSFMPHPGYVVPEVARRLGLCLLSVRPCAGKDEADRVSLRAAEECRRDPRSCAESGRFFEPAAGVRR